MKTGYEISLKDFHRLCTDHRSEVAPLLRSWFGCEVEPVGHGFLLRESGSGFEADPSDVHKQIQADAERQGGIYRVAMTLWR